MYAIIDFKSCLSLKQQSIWLFSHRLNEINTNINTRNPNRPSTARLDKSLSCYVICLEIFSHVVFDKEHWFDKKKIFLYLQVDKDGQKIDKWPKNYFEK